MEINNTIAAEKINANIAYLKSVKIDNLLKPYRYEAGLVNETQKNTDQHWGWEGPYSQIRGTFLGHYLSACSQIVHYHNNIELEVNIKIIIEELAKCQQPNGWIFSIPENYIKWLVRGKHTWAPHYVCHKTLMGLLDVYMFMGNKKALELVVAGAAWFYEFLEELSDEQVQYIIELEETGGICELFGNLYEVTGDQKHLELAERYVNQKYLNALLTNEQIISNRHANSMIPEIHGMCVLYNITGDMKYRKATENFWNLVYVEHGCFASGGQTSGEVFTPKQKQVGRLGDRNQELCTVYNMIRLADYLYNWEKKTEYIDYIERNIYNGIFTQGYYQEKSSFFQNEDITPKKGHVLYYFGFEAEAQNQWGSEFDHFWCCHCTLVQSFAIMPSLLYKKEDHTIYVNQFFSMCDSELKIDAIYSKNSDGHFSRENHDNIHISILNEKIRNVNVRIPSWATSYEILAGELIKVENNYLHFSTGEIEIRFHKELKLVSLPDKLDVNAVIYGPILLVGKEMPDIIMNGSNDPKSFLIPHNEIMWGTYSYYFKTINQPVNYKFVPAYEIGYSKYTTYFQIRK